MKKEEEDKFFKELSEIKPFLPKRYFGVIEFLYPGKWSQDDIYNVIHHGVKDKEILKALKKVVKKTKVAA